MSENPTRKVRIPTGMLIDCFEKDQTAAAIASAW